MGKIFKINDGEDEPHQPAVIHGPVWPSSTATISCPKWGYIPSKNPRLDHFGIDTQCFGDSLLKETPMRIYQAPTSAFFGFSEVEWLVRYIHDGLVGLVAKKNLAKIKQLYQL